MNPLTLVKRIQKMNSREAALGISEETLWHAKYKDSAYVFVGSVPFDLTEEDTKEKARKEAAMQILQKTKRASPGVVIAFVLLISAALLSVWRNMRSNEKTEEEYVEVVSGMPIRLSYADLKYINDDFSQKLGVLPHSDTGATEMHGGMTLELWKDDACPCSGGHVGGNGAKPSR
ncbi:hypothetical protein MLD38_018506 [Melastoma candidum]|uniref:Uncharacterized protein n=1 Tax=Melastoma candidum TaxID=119954 RepID=A0ACB9QTZ1_9MYRT|nr:hypothetical protein MLD38_018506 [Melastoma candidum]